MAGAPQACYGHHVLPSGRAEYLSDVLLASHENLRRAFVPICCGFLLLRVWLPDPDAHHLDALCPCRGELTNVDVFCCGCLLLCISCQREARGHLCQRILWVLVPIPVQRCGDEQARVLGLPLN